MEPSGGRGKIRVRFPRELVTFNVRTEYVGIVRTEHDLRNQADGVGEFGRDEEIEFARLEGAVSGRDGVAARATGIVDHGKYQGIGDRSRAEIEIEESADLQLRAAGNLHHVGMRIVVGNRGYLGVGVGGRACSRIVCHRDRRGSGRHQRRSRDRGLGRGGSADRAGLALFQVFNAGFGGREAVEQSLNRLRHVRLRGIGLLRGRRCLSHCEARHHQQDAGLSSGRISKRQFAVHTGPIGNSPTLL